MLQYIIFRIWQHVLPPGRVAGPRARPLHGVAPGGPRRASVVAVLPHHGRRQRHAGLVLGRRRVPRRATPRSRTAAELAAEGADILDVGGESTRPGAEPVRRGEELRRVLPVVEGARAARRGARISIDTSKAAVAARRARRRRGLRQRRHRVPRRPGARRRSWPSAAPTAASCTCSATPRTMQDDPRYDDVVAEVKAFLEERLAFAVGEGIAEERIELDPGIGFGKTRRRTTSSCCAGSTRSSRSGGPSWSATSRKSFLGTHHRPRATARPGRATRRHERARARARRDASSASTTSPPTRDALAVAAATLAAAMARDDAEDYDDDDDELTDDDDEDDGPEVGVTIEIVGPLALHPPRRHARPSARSASGSCSTCASTSASRDAPVTDRVEDTVDYGEVCQVDRADRPAALLQDARAPVRGDRRPARSQFGAESVTVKAAKPEPPIPLPVEEVSVEVWREERTDARVEVEVSRHYPALPWPPDEPTRRKSAEQRREEIVQIAIEHFALGGYNGTSTEADRARRRHLPAVPLPPLQDQARAVPRLPPRDARAHPRDVRARRGRRRRPARRSRRWARLHRPAGGPPRRCSSRCRATPPARIPRSRRSVRACYGELVEPVTRLSGAEPQEVWQFFAYGMLLNVMASLDLHADRRVGGVGGAAGATRVR